MSWREPRRPRGPKSDFWKSRHLPKTLTTKRRRSRMGPAKEGGEYVVSGPQGNEIYAPDRHTSLPPLTNAPGEGNSNTGTVTRRRRSRAQSVLYPYIHGHTRNPRSALPQTPSPSPSRATSALSGRSKDDSRIHYELTMDDNDDRSLLNTDPWRARKVRIYRNGDRYFPGVEFTFKPGRDVVNMEALCDKITDRIGLARGARYIFGLDGRRRYRIEELEDGHSYVASSDRKFVNLAYGKQRPDWNSPSVVPDRSNGVRSRPSSPIVRELPNGSGGGKKSSADSNKSGNSKPGSREGRTIKIINNLDHSQERSVLVNMKTIQSWEDVVADLGQVLKMKGTLHMYTAWGQEVKSFSQFKNDFMNADTFYLSPADFHVAIKNGSPGTSNDARRMASSRNTERRGARTSRRSTLRRHTSEPTLKETPEEADDEVADGRAAVVTIRGQQRVFHAPTGAVKHNSTPPHSRLTLDWVYGYRGGDTRRNLWVLPSGELLYYVAAVAVIFERTDDIQRHYTEHTEDIQCMALHPTRELVASGQRASRGLKTTAHVRVWNSRTLHTIHVLGHKELGLGILALAFSVRNNGAYLLAVDADKEHLLSVWTWDNKQIFGRVATHQDHVWGAAFHPHDNNLIITFGRGLLSLWARRKDGIFQRSDLIPEDSTTTITSLEFTSSGDLVAGQADGRISVWSVNADEEYYVKREFQAHLGSISSLQMLSEGTVLSGGDKDRRIVAWDCEEDFEKIAETKLPEQAGGVRTLYPQRPGLNDGNIYVGTVKNMILEGSLQRRFNQVVFGHSKQLWGLAVNQEDGSVVTAGYDKHIVKWRENKLQWRIQAQSECVSVAVHPFGTVIAAGTIDGHLIILNATSGLHVATVRVCGSPLSCLAYNPAGELLAVGSQNGSLYLYKTTKDGFVYNRFGRMGGAQPLSGIDWSTSGVYLQTVTSDYDITYWNLRDLSRVKNPVDVRNETWVTHTCPLGYMVHGVWAGGRDAPIQVTLDRGPRGDVVAAGDTDGYIRLYRYPVLSRRAGYHEYKVYTSYVSGLRFSHIDDMLYSIGDTDAAFMRWRVN
ncbi:doublecortin-domain-containing echinoderm-microtubule-associated protein isoform X3 [Oratosquilla oratoria]|uniref:doublecortin-domain-containing echinoderm-microtubule-associated protein isoform X3 n=1 Tax=Oratosquilla oratoria TaxID=337810 RepID=UPI003F7781C0